MPAPGVARQYPFDGQIPAFKNTILFQGGDPVGRAGGRVPALAAQEGGNAPLV